MSLTYKIRPTHPGDAREMHSLRSHSEVSPMLLSLPTERQERIAGLLMDSSPLSHQFVAVDEESGRLLGSAGIIQRQGRQAHTGDIGIMVHPDAQGKGIGRALMNALIDLADNWLLLDRLALTVFSGNDKAEKLYLSLGFEREAVLREGCVGHGRYEDEIAMGRLRPGFVPPPPKPYEAAEPPRQENTSLQSASFRIRPLRREDCAAVAEYQARPGSFELLNTLPSQRIRALEDWFDALDPHQSFLLAAVIQEGDQEQAIGVVSMEISANPRLRHVGSLGLGVSPDWQGRGVGKALLAAMIDVADRWMDLRRLQLTVLAGNHRAISLYRSHGFQEEGRYIAASSFAGGYTDEIVMSRIK